MLLFEQSDGLLGLAPVPPECSKWPLGPVLGLQERSEWLLGPAPVPPEHIPMLAHSLLLTSFRLIAALPRLLA